VRFCYSHLNNLLLSNVYNPSLCKVSSSVINYTLDPDSTLLVEWALFTDSVKLELVLIIGVKLLALTF